MTTAHPVNGDEVNTGVLLYADDIDKLTPIYDNSTVPEVLEQIESALAEATMAVGVAQNRSNHEHLLHLVGRGAHEVPRQHLEGSMKIVGKMLPIFLHLGVSQIVLVVCYRKSMRELLRPPKHGG